jgi:hypothetical protein
MRAIVAGLGALVLVCGLFTLPSSAQIPAPPEGEEGLGQTYTGRVYSPYADRDFPSQVYWGDTHLHTSLSMDAGAFGNRLGLDEAYRFARGEQVMASAGQKARLSRPLDFLVVADHSDNMGFFPDLFAGKEFILEDPTGRDWYERIQAGKGPGVALELIGLFSQGEFPEALVYTPDSAPYRSAWQATVAAAERHNTPGQFTAFIGYEWTSLVQGNNMHRVVVYRDGGDKGGQMVPFTTYPPAGSTNPRDLWRWMADYEKRTQGRVLAIAHNGNLANGIMFPLEAQYDGTVLEGAPLRGHPDQGRRRDPPVPLAQRRVRRLRDLGHRQPRRLAGEERRHVGRRVRTRGAQARPRHRDEARHEPVSLRDDRLHRQPHLPRHRAGEQLLRQALRRRAEPEAHEPSVHAERERDHHGLAAGGLRPRGRVGPGEHA